MFLAGAAITFAVATGTFWIGHRLLKIPMTLMLGVLAGVQTQSAVLGFALEQTRNDLPNFGYTTAYPVATVAKILASQMILSIMLGH